jgi:hypothetical protein
MKDTKYTIEPEAYLPEITTATTTIITSPEDKASIFSLISYSWLDGLFRLGFKRTLEASDIPAPPKRLQAALATPAFEQSWEEEKERAKNDITGKNPASLRKSVWRVVYWDMVRTGL